MRSEAIFIQLPHAAFDALDWSPTSRTAAQAGDRHIFRPCGLHLSDDRTGRKMSQSPVVGGQLPFLNHAVSRPSGPCEKAAVLQTANGSFPFRGPSRAICLGWARRWQGLGQRLRAAVRSIATGTAVNPGIITFCGISSTAGPSKAATTQSLDSWARFDAGRGGRRWRGGSSRAWRSDSAPFAFGRS